MRDMERFARQTSIWEELERELSPGLKEICQFLDAVPCDALVDRLNRERDRGRDDYPVRPMLRLVLSKLYLRHGRFSQLLAELKRNGDLARVLGFEQVLPGQFKIPSASALCRFHGTLKADAALADLALVFQRTVALLKDVNPDFGKHTALDATDIRTHGHGERKGKDGEKRPSTDLDASWSVKTKRWEDAQGHKREEKQSTFGFKAYFCVDVEVPAICALETVTGKTNDQTMALPVLDAALSNLGQGQIETCAMDKGFDSTETVMESFRRRVAAIVPVREVPEPLEQQKKEDREIPMSKNSNIVRDSFSGVLACYSPGVAVGQMVRREMIYGGFEWERETHKFRCPLGSSASQACSAFSSCHAGSSGKQGRQVRVELETDVRRFAPVYPRSKRWRRLYNGRSAVERINSYLKEVLRLEDHCLRGKNAISLRVTLAAITLNIRTLLALRAEKSRALDSAVA